MQGQQLDQIHRSKSEIQWWISKAISNIKPFMGESIIKAQVDP